MLKRNLGLFGVLFAAALFFNGCESEAPSQEEKNAKEKVDDAEKQLKEVKQEEKIEEDNEEWILFKRETEEKIRNNEIRIAELREKKAKPGEKLDSYYTQRIDALNEKNIALRNRIENFNKNRSEWEAFKREFNNDMEELGNSLKNFTVDGK